METTPPHKSSSRELVERTVEAGLGSVPVFGNALAVAFVTAIGWRLEDRREKWFTELAEGVEELRQRVDGLDLEDLADNDLFVDAVVTASLAAQHTHQAEKIEALRNAVLNSVAPDAPDADTQAIMLGLIDQWTPSHFRMLTLWNDPPGWFAARGIPDPREQYYSAARTVTVEAGMPEMKDRSDFYTLIAGDLGSAGMLTAGLGGMVSARALMDRLTTSLGRQFVNFISAPAIS